MSIVPTLTILQSLKPIRQFVSLDNLAEEVDGATKKEILIGLANPMAGLVENSSEEMIN